MHNDSNYKPEYAIAWAVWIMFCIALAWAAYLIFQHSPKHWVLALAGAH